MSLHDLPYSGPTSERIWLEEDLVELLEKAAAMGFDLEAGSDLEKMTIADLDRLVNQRQ